MDTIHVDVWLYGPIARYAGDQSKGSHANLDLEMPAGSTMHDLLERLGVPSEERGITFVNGKLAALPGLEADLGATGPGHPPRLHRRRATRGHRGITRDGR
ncbi:MAG: hypothetical protein P8129_20960 [Anaerolineae bacterium]